MNGKNLDFWLAY
jgi:hypothetical protein